MLLAVLVMLASLLGSDPHPPARVEAPPDYGFRFVRIQFDSNAPGRRSRGGAPWSHDHPRAELQFHEALERTTRVHIDGPPLVLTLKDARIFEHPLLYLCEPGYWTMDDEEVETLRAYLDRGGFILFDDFRGPRELQQLVDQMKRVFPDREPVEIAPDHPIWSIYYDIDPVAAPSLVGGGFRFVEREDRYFALFDDRGRMLALMCYNQDIGDGWEWPERNFEDASTISFQMGINFLIYALTH